jgi:hypothetical protein
MDKLTPEDKNFCLIVKIYDGIGSEEGTRQNGGFIL